MTYFTLTNYLWFIGEFVFSWLIIVLILSEVDDHKPEDAKAHHIFLRTTVISLIIVAITAFGTFLWNTNTADGQRALKESKSNFNNGLEREITITAEDGRQIFHYEGRFDIEDDGKEKHIIFENEQGKRIVIYYGITDTVIIEEK